MLAVPDEDDGKLGMGTGELKTSATEKMQHLLLVSDSVFQNVGAALWNDLAPQCFLFVFLLNPEYFIATWLSCVSV